MSEITVKWGKGNWDTITIAIPAKYNPQDTTEVLNKYLSENPLVVNYSMHGYG